jgi:hypothetical protein
MQSKGGQLHCNARVTCLVRVVAPWALRRRRGFHASRAVLADVDAALVLHLVGPETCPRTVTTFAASWDRGVCKVDWN